ncbi:MAG: protein kinase [Gemmataceae bacterium]
MPASCPTLDSGKVDFERSAGGSSDDQVRLTPSPSQSDYFLEMTNWVCEDLKQSWRIGKLKQIEDYQTTFPELFHHRPSVQTMVDLDYALRLKLGETPSVQSYLPQWGVTPRQTRDITVDTPLPVRSIDQTVIHSVIPIQNPNDLDAAGQEPVHNQSVAARESEYDEYEQVSREEFPVPGQTVEGFLLKELLGRGAFAQVYLAEQVGLSNRLVAVKLTRRLGKEAGRLARLQHANVVPIFSFHPGRDWQAICMPFFGRQTLDDIIRSIRQTHRIPKSGCEIFSTVAAQADSTVRSSSLSHTKLPKVDVIRPSDAGSHGQLRDVLTHLSYSDAAVLLVAQMTDGLSHAHSLGIWHLDLKPANVLISDHGQPMLLDFNLAFDTVREDRQRFGGTVAYMAPEQIEEMIESRRRHDAGINLNGPRISKVDQRSDLYSIGVILFELLTGRHPFPVSKSKQDPFEAARIARELPRPTARQLNPSISHSINAIIERLLSNRMEDRYPSAVALRQDLIGHLEHKPLVYIKEPSLIERFQKWNHRHPKVLTRTIAAASVCLAVSASGWGYGAWNQSQSTVARQRVEKFRSNLASLRLDLADHEKKHYIARGLQRASDYFKEFGIDGKTDLNNLPQFARLDPEERKSAMADFGEIALLASLATQSQLKSVPAEERLLEKQKWESLSEYCFQGQPAPAVVGGEDQGVRSNFIAASIAIREGRYDDAINLLERVVIEDPQNAAAHSLYCNALLSKQQFARAMERGAMAGALLPNDPRPKMSRLFLLQQDNNIAGVEACLSEILLLEPNAENYYLRAKTRSSLRKFDEALADCDKAGAFIRLDFMRLHVLRSNIHKAMNHPGQAKSDAKLVAHCSPVTAADFFTRGYERLVNKDLTHSIEDFQRAIDENPRMVEAWYNQGLIYSEYLNNTDKALKVIESAIQSNLQNGELRMFHAILLARKGNRSDALKEMTRGLRFMTNQKQLYNAACICALTSKTHPADALVAIEYLKQSLRNGVPDIPKIKGDTDLKPILQRTDVKQLLDAAQKLN